MYRISLTISVLLLAFGHLVKATSVQVHGLNRAKDVAFTPGRSNSRVDRLVAFFESMANDDFTDPEVRAKQEVLISLPEATSKFHALSVGLPLDVKCNKYFKLISMPDIRTFASINLLMKENLAFEEKEQEDANLASRLTSQWTYDAIGRMQVLLETLESERINGKSPLEPEVQRDLLNCMSYFLYRQRNAALGSADYIRQSLQKLQPSLTETSQLESSLKKLLEQMDIVKRLDADASNRCSVEWLDAMSKMHDIIVENKFLLPITVQEFATDPTRLSILSSCQTLALDPEDLMDQAAKLESNSDDIVNDPNYRQVMMKLYQVWDSRGDSTPANTVQFIHEPIRWSIIQDELANSNRKSDQGQQVESSRTDEVAQDNQKVATNVEQTNSPRDSNIYNGQSLKQLSSRAERLEATSDDVLEDSQYRAILIELYKLWDSQGDNAPDELVKFIQEPMRWYIIQDELARHPLTKVEPEVETEPPTTTTEAPATTETPTTTTEATTTTTEAPTTTPTTEQPVTYNIVITTSAPMIKLNGQFALRRKAAKAEAMSKMATKGEFGHDIEPGVGVNRRIHVIGDKQKAFCENLLIQLSADLRNFKWASLSLDDGQIVFERLFKFKNKCAPMKLQGSQWTIISLTRKIHLWTVSMLKNQNLDQDDRLFLASVLEFMRSK